MENAPVKVMRNVSVLVCLCSLSFYVSSQVVGETKSYFSSKKSTAYEIHTAFVFPKTIENLQQRAQDVTNRVSATYESISGTELSLKVATSKLDEVSKKLEEMKKDQISLQTMNKQMVDYYQKAQQEPPVSKDVTSKYRSITDYVNPAYASFEKMVTSVDTYIKNTEKIKADLTNLVQDQPPVNVIPSALSPAKTPSLPQTKTPTTAGAQVSSKTQP